MPARRALLCGRFFGRNARPCFFAPAPVFAVTLLLPEVCRAHSRMEHLPETWRLIFWPWLNFTLNIYTAKKMDILDCLMLVDFVFCRQVIEAGVSIATLFKTVLNKTNDILEHSID